MFGHQDDQPQNTQNGGDVVFPPADLLADGLGDNPAASTTVGAPADSSQSDDTSVVSPVTPVEPANDAPIIEPTPEVSQETEPDFTFPTDQSSPTADDLIGIKQSALEQLTPLVDQLDQTPEEKFRTTMMMIQAADNKALIKTAYEAAQKIVDEKAKAQALLDVVNEINYFTQNNS